MKDASKVLSDLSSMTDNGPSSQSALAQAFRLHMSGDLSAAERIYQALLLERPNHPDAMHLLGVIALQTQRTEHGIALIQRSLALNPGNVAAHNNLGKALLGLNRTREAVACFEAALRIEPNSADAHMQRAGALVRLHRVEEALDDYRVSLLLQPKSAELHRSFGHALLRLKRYREAFEAYDQAYRLQPALAGVESYRLHSKMLLCDWRDLRDDIEHLTRAVRAGTTIAQPFTFLAISSQAHDQLACARAWVAQVHPASQPTAWVDRPGTHNRIRVAYLSADFRHHPTALAVVGLLESHDRSRFDVSAISLGGNDSSSVRRRIEAAVEHFIDVGSQADDEIVQLTRSLDFDIVVDLMGFTDGARVGLLARRLAPLQVSYMGYAGTMGAPYVDYIIGDGIVIPPAARMAYAESVVSLPESFFVNDSTRPISERQFSRAELGLPPSGLVLCCFNNAYKITPDVFDAWMDILRAVPESVLWLASMTPATSDHLRNEATKRAIESNRLIFADRLPTAAEHLARYRVADLFLDTTPYNAHATATDALWAGLPVLTCTGETFASRVGASLLAAVGLPELAAGNLDDYRRLAIALARDGDRLGEIKARLNRNRLTSPLFDTKRTTRYVESAYCEMYRRRQSGLAPSDIIVSG